MKRSLKSCSKQLHLKENGGINISKIEIDIPDPLPEDICENSEKGITISESFNSVAETSHHLAAVFQPRYNFTATIVQTLESFRQQQISQMALITETLVSSMSNMINSFADQIYESISTPVLDWFRQSAVSPIQSLLVSLRQVLVIDFDDKYYTELYLQEMYDAHWFPYVGWRNTDISLAIEINSILEHSRKSKNRIKKMDRAIFDYYDAREIKFMQRFWRKIEYPSPQKRIMIEALKAYERKEYALVVIPLCTLWEGIIYEKSNDSSKKTSEKTKRHFADLINQNEYEKIFDSYFEDFIFYPCYNKSEVIPDVPGRHGIAHSWYNQYPNKKSALNAIMFTDFLLSLDSLPDTKNVQEDAQNG